MERCPGIKRDGTRCTVNVEPPSAYCWWHDPANADQRRRAASRGGKRAGRGRPLTELAELKELLRGLADDVVAGNVETNRAAVAGQLLNTVIRAISVEVKVREVEDLTREVEELREMVEANEGNLTNGGGYEASILR